jgi:hypothetical protein
MILGVGKEYSVLRTRGTVFTVVYGSTQYCSILRVLEYSDYFIKDLPAIRIFPPSPGITITAR